MFFYVINWGIFYENLVTCKRWDGFKEEKLYYGGSLKHPIFRGCGGGGGLARKPNIEGGNCQKGVGLGQFADLRGLAKKGMTLKLGGWYPFTDYELFR